MQRKQQERPLNVVTVGRLPPPVGGVASSIQSIIRESNKQEDIKVRLINWTEMWKLPIHRPDFLHLHFSKPTKRAIGSLIGLLAGAKVIHTVHSNHYEFNNFGNWLTARISSGFILLNEDVMRRFRSKNIKNLSLMTPVLASATTPTEVGLDSDLESWIQRQKGNIAVIYCSDRREQNGADIYGFSFVAELLPRLQRMNWSVLFLDPNNHYTSDELFPRDAPNAFLRSSHVEFASVLQHVAVYLRPTATDGNSVAVLEALSAQIPVIASDVVPRPQGVRLFRFLDQEDFLEKLSHISDPDATLVAPELTTFDEYVQFLRSLCPREV